MIKNALISAGASLGGALAASVIVCAVGGIPTLGIACATVPAALGGAVVAAVGGAIASVIKDFVYAQINRIKAMADANWFVWSNTKVIWNSFGDISDTNINPSLTNFNPNPFHRGEVRIGVQWSNVSVGQGPEFFSAKEGGSSFVRAADNQSSLPLPTQQDHRVASPQQRVLIGGPRDRTLIGGSHTSIIYGVRATI